MTIPPLKRKKPDIVYWKKNDNTCFIIDTAVGLDLNITKKVNLKHNNYMQLSSELKQLYPNFSFEIVPIVLGAARLVTSDIEKNIEKLGIVSINHTLAKCQQMVLLGHGEHGVFFITGLSLQCQHPMPCCCFDEIPLLKSNHVLTEMAGETVW